MFDLEAIQATLSEFNLDGWLLYDFRGSNVLAQRILQIPTDQMDSRRFFYFVPAEGPPQKLVHRIEASSLDHLPGEKHVYLKWQTLEQEAAAMLGDAKRIAMEYSPRAANPYVARVDAGTVELIKSFGVEIVSSGDLIQRFEASWGEREWQLHLTAAEGTNGAFEKAWAFIADSIRNQRPINEVDVQQIILDHFAANSLITDHPPIVAVGPHSGDPHYAPSPENNTPINEGDFVLIDLWAKCDDPQGVYSDLTRVGFVGEIVPPAYEEIFRIVANARDAGIDCVRSAFAAGQTLQGWQVDQATRDVIDTAGYGDFFVHRTGHSIGQETHGNGANMDNLETREERLVMRSTCFSIEPGIYLSEFGVRSEVDIFVDANGEVHVTGGEVQTKVLAILR